MAETKYQISLWEDVVVAASGEPGSEGYIPEHFEEQKLCDIGSDQMTTACRAYEPQLIENINGTNTFRFKMYYVYRDLAESTELLQNPFLNLLVNERRVKVFWKDKWYDFVIKDINEDSSGKSITYTCTDLYINELSKNGFNLEFDTELENNQGTASELTERVLEGTDWQLRGDSDIIQQEVEEPVYEVVVSEDWVVTNQTNGGTIEIPAGATVLVYYNQLQPIINGEEAAGALKIQFAYSENYLTDSLASMLVVNATCCATQSAISWTKTNTQIVFDEKLTINYLLGVSDNYRANRLVESQKTILDPLTDKYVKVYIATASDPDGAFNAGDTIYGYQSTEYKDPTFVNNLLVNSSNFSGLSGWVGTSGPWALYPSYTQAKDLSTYEAKSYLRLKGDSVNTYIYNDGLYSSLSYLPDGFTKGEYYIFRFKAMKGSATAPNGTYYTASGHVLDLIVYQSDTDKQPTQSTYFNNVTYTNGADGWVEARMRCVRSASRGEIISKKISFFLALRTTANIWIEEVQFFPEIYGSRDGNRVRINPGEMDIESVVTIVNKFYNHTQNEGLTDVSQLQYIYSGADNTIANVEPIINDNFVKIRSINAKQSNRFNILQSIAETFECWMRFDIEHDPITGRMIYINGIPQKFVTIKKEIGQETGIGFVYGLDLKTIQRNIKSSDIVTKTIVSPNANEFARDGFCTIARSEENYPRETFILDFGYYITHGLLDGNRLNRDLYLSTDSIGYYYNLNRLNTQYDAITEELRAKKTELTKQQSYQTVYEEYLTSLQSERDELANQIIQLADASSLSAATAYAKKNPNYEELNTRITARNNCINNIKAYTTILNNLNSSIENLQLKIDEWEEEQNDITEELKALHFEFYKKYSRFIQEGSWTSEEYLDDNLYYLDARSIAYTSSRPQVSYNISVIRLNEIEEFKNRKFYLGDIAHIQDTEFFGYVFINGIKTPYKEKVLISEVTSNFDSPEKDSFKVQNYKTQFEDLFQRINATTQSLQYASGEYARAASIVETNGTINPETLQSSIALNSELVYSARNDAIVQDSTGITVTNASNPSQKTKVTSGGVFITTDGGITWKNAIRGEGIATQYLTSGAINTQSITILDEEVKTFRWDSDGISAYDRTGGTDNVDTSTFTRFDEYGIYGIKEQTDFKPETEKDVWDNASFALTWRGFLLNNAEGIGRLSITSDNDIQVFGPRSLQTRSAVNEVERVKIGRLYTSNNESGYTPLDESVTEPTDGIDYYVINPSSGSYVLDNLIYFASGEIYFEDVDNYKVLSYDVRPIPEKIYYQPATWVATAPSGEFESGATYYELASEEYSPTTDTAPIWGKTYYLPVDPNDLTSGYLTADIYYYFLDNTYYYKLSNNEYILATETEPIVGISYYTPNTWNSITFTRAFDPNTTYYTRDHFVYGIRISDGLGNSVMEQTSDGRLWLKHELHISSTARPVSSEEPNPNDYDIRLGYLNEHDSRYVLAIKPLTEFDPSISYYELVEGEYEPTSDQTPDVSKDYYVQINRHEIMNVNNGNFIVYEDGSIVAEDGSFRGAIYATSGTFEGTIAATSGMFGQPYGERTFGAGGAEIGPNGLEFYNSAFNIYYRNFNLTDDTTLNQDKTYYQWDEDLVVYSAITNPSSGANPHELGWYEKEDISVFSYDAVNNKLLSSGGAAFEGKISALEGQIGGLQLSNESLYSLPPVTQDTEVVSGKTYYELVDGEFIEVLTPASNPSEAGYYDHLPNLQIYGASGRMVVNQLEMGTNSDAQVAITLGNGRIYNPAQRENNSFIELVSDFDHMTPIFRVSNEGFLTLGASEEIKLNGTNSTIEVGSLKLDGMTSAITGDFGHINPQEALFNNIVATGKIVSSVFETQKIQAVGGSMYFRPTYKILSQSIVDNKVAVVLDKSDTLDLVSGSWVSAVNANGDSIGNYQVITYQSETNTLTLDASTILSNPLFLIYQGVSNQDILIGINTLASAAPYLAPQGITIATFDNSTSNPHPAAFLGNLDGLNIANVTGFGLYASNAYLEGSLTTRIRPNGTYAGINTNSGIQAEVFAGIGNEEDKSSIVFWGGAKSAAETDIKQAPFQVTEKGSFYASQGYFKGSILVDATITAATIRTARIEGTGGTDCGLFFYNVDDPIRFGKSESGVESYYYSLTNNGLRVDSINQIYAIDITHSNVTFNGHEYYTVVNNNYNKYLLNSNGLSYMQGQADVSEDDYNVIGTYGASTSGLVMAVGTNTIELQSGITHLHNQINFNGQMDLQYKPVIGGYDLYVTDSE